MKLLFDYSIFVRQAQGGVSRALYELFRYFVEEEEVTCKLFAGFHKNMYLKQAPPQVKRHIIGWYLPPWMVKRRIMMPLNQVLFFFYARWFKPSVCHHTYFATPPLPKGCKRILGMYDMISEKYPESLHAAEQKSQEKRHAIQAADGVVCISENTRHDLLETFPLREIPVEVIYLGNSFEGTQPDVTEAPYAYLLYVGSRKEVYKNFPFLVQAMAATNERTGYHLVCFGGGGFSKEELQLFKQSGLQKLVHHREGDDEELARAYAGARALVYPSLYEGFGLPPLEAMGLGCPVLASNAAPMPEIVGEAGESFDPTSSHELETSILKLQAPLFREELIRKGREQATQFSWKNTTQCMLEFYRTVLKEVG